MIARPFWLKLLIPFVALSLLVAALSLALSYWVAQGSVYVDQARTLATAAGIVRAAVTPDGSGIRPAAVDRLRALAVTADVRVTVIRGDGTVLMDTVADPGHMENHNNRPEVIDARRQNLGSASHLSATLHQPATYLAQIADDTRPDGLVVRTCYPTVRWSSLRAPLWAVTAGSLAATVVMVLVLVWVIQRQWVRPTRDLTGAAERMAAGHWNARVDPHGSPDVRFLAEKMNELATQAENQLAELGKQRRDLRSLVDTLPDPILVTDAAGRVVLVNVPAADLLQLSPASVVGQKIGNVVGEDALLQLLDAASGVAASWVVPPVQREVRLFRGGHRRTFQSVAARNATGGSLLLLRDVTAMALAVQMKTDFVANASHELRTPIAAIKIAMETLRDVYGEDPDQAERCVNIIEGHIKRLEELLRDLLDLSRLENPDAEPNLADVKPWDLFAIVRSTLGPTARQKGVDLRFDLPPGGPDTFSSDERLLNLVLKNLVENSVKFTPGGGSITVSFASTQIHTRPAVVLEVADTGCGIPSQHLDRVFERFYQVDAARSGTAGRGTGLGLAIVKHAVAALGGTVNLESTVGVGTVVTCTLPQTAPAAAAAMR
jgi:two-component system phosphate regulon sensor histidine kinase PhoR